MREIQKNDGHPLYKLQPGPALDSARRTDLIMDPEDENGFILLCPETNGEGSEVLAARLEETVREELGQREMRVCFFPTRP